MVGPDGLLPGLVCSRVSGWHVAACAQHGCAALPGLFAVAHSRAAAHFGSSAGCTGYRIDPAQVLAERGQLNTLVYDCTECFYNVDTFQKEKAWKP
jgi:hypothetical protein